MNRCAVQTGRLAAIVALATLAATVTPARAQVAISATYLGHVMHFAHVDNRNGATAIGAEDPGLQSLLSATGAFLTWKPGERYVLITTSAPTVVSFAVGDRRYDVGPIALQAGIAPYLRGDEAYLPLREVLAALDLALRSTPSGNVLQPELAAIDVHQDGVRTTVLAHGGALLHARVVNESSSAITYAFDGVGTTLAGTRQAGTDGIESVVLANGGTVRDPIALLTVKLAPGTVPETPQNVDGRDVLLAFDAAAQGASYAQPSYAQPSNVQPPANEPPDNVSPPSLSSSQATVSGVTVEPNAGGTTVEIAVDGNATYSWHRLRDPDNRFWVDISGAQLQTAPIDEQGTDPITALRVRQNDAQTVRVALSLSGPNSVTVSPSQNGLTITIGAPDVADAQRSGSGSIGGGIAVSNGGAESNGSDNGNASPQPPAVAQGPGWKFAPHGGYAPTNPHLIVIDPGHGGSDRGSVHGGLSEATVNLDVAKRLRAILVERGWQVKMTHETDVDVYQPNDSAHDELQARVDVANSLGARAFVSVHANAYINSGPYGTTLYVSKAEDVPLARAIETKLADDGTKDDGIVKSHMYVTYHTRMPAVLIETAFLTNPNDYALLASPAWRQKVAEEMADGIVQYAQDHPVPDQSAQADQ
jgi:N-acetylmuramoyl-L-alanine amidase